MADTTPQAADHATPEQAAAFIQRWTDVQLNSATELSVSQTFVIELCDLLGVLRPLANAAQDYQFERPITFINSDGST